MDCPVEVAEKRDPKGLYKKAREGVVKEFTGVSAPYEEPEEPEVRIRSDQMSIEEAVEKVMDYLNGKNLLTKNP